MTRRFDLIVLVFAAALLDAAMVLAVTTALAAMSPAGTASLAAGQAVVAWAVLPVGTGLVLGDAAWHAAARALGRR